MRQWFFRPVQRDRANVGGSDRDIRSKVTTGNFSPNRPGTQVVAPIQRVRVRSVKR